MRYLVMAALLAMATPAAAGGLGDILKGKKPQATTPVVPPGQVPPTTPGIPATAGNADKAKVSFDVAEIELQASKLYVSGLADLASKPTTWEKESSVHLFNQAQRTVIRAEQQLADLETMAVGQWAKAGDPIRHARAELVNTEQQLRNFSSAVKAGQYQAGAPEGIKSLWGTIDRAQKDVEGAAGMMGVDFHLKGL